jgi:hypothetical protein
MPPSSDGLDPYAPPRSDTAAAPPGIGDLTREQVQAFAGQRANYYWRQWSRVAPRRRLAGFNWAAALLSFFWFLYRRMYREFAALIGITFALGLLETLLAYVVGRETRDTMSRLDNVGLGLAAGFLGNSLYLRRARAAVAAARARHPDSAAEQQAFLAACGGTSSLAVFLGVTGSVALIAVISLIVSTLQRR